MSQIIKLNSTAQLLEAFKELEQDYQVYCPVTQDDTETFLPLNQITEEEVDSVTDILFQNQPTLYPVKSFVFHDSEAYLKFSREQDRVEFSTIEGDNTTRVVLGGKPCDIESIGMIDKVFLEEPVDTFYQENREKTILISTVCAQKGPNCMCDEFGINRTAPELADIYLIKGEETTQGNQVFLKSNSDKGRKLLEKLAQSELVEQLNDLPESASKELSNQEREQVEELSPEEVKDVMEDLFDDNIWDELALRCMGCGICTYYCPTCHCYDIQDFYRQNQGVRYRTWDSCMFSDYTNMAGGHNPRPQKADRIKNRFFHKLNYFVKKQGPIACVGCGRCAQNCPVGISINTVLKRIGGEKFV
ncbi:4Fe-4S dicluster domain-containing protein [Natranaerobius thermophilus]|uniref:Putative anaerobic sulfite reductase, A subunit n=1 Tax=Natranaerobius thermophilus (strain ATCC BAA-1301 / DSM 18059 / JW/NM-WN-LF) TaxID=457570 RepID=B2A2A8_NATTJ|nr:4Fe-4S dicluster domain-containing protein [Natranaerobius thermophilus]ACB86214.1 putative anaerobic sulfite reductase, A subunit [Natranaerobius thermophilus JW/NM-WN-LF]